MSARRRLWISITACVLVVSLLASIALVFADEWIPPANTPAPTYVPVTTPATAFTEPGNGEVQDHVDDEGSKEFYTVQTHNGNTFYIVIDKARTDDNVYMLSQVDENDLMKFTETEEPETTPQVVVEETPTVTEPETPKKNSKLQTWILILMLLAMGTVGYLLYTRYVLPRKDEPVIESEDLETVEVEAFPEEPLEPEEEEDETNESDDG